MLVEPVPSSSSDFLQKKINKQVTEQNLIFVGNFIIYVCDIMNLYNTMIISVSTCVINEV